MVCRNCGYQNKAGNTFCTGCGGSLTAEQYDFGWTCPACGRQNKESAKFCGGCGYSGNAPVPAPPPKPTRKKGPLIAGICAAVLAVLVLLTCAWMFLSRDDEDSRDSSSKNAYEDRDDSDKQEDEDKDEDRDKDQDKTQSEDPDEDGIGAVEQTDAPAAVHTHEWEQATCQKPRTCSTCGETTGEIGGHLWVDGADYRECITCGLTESTKTAPEPVYLNELACNGGVWGKIWTRSTEDFAGFRHSNEDHPDCWSDWNTWGHTSGVVRDNCGNEYTYGLHIDGHETDTYYIGFYLEGAYTTFTGTCACPERSSVISSYVYNASAAYTKYFEIYGDGVLLFTSAAMRYDYAPQTFTIDITGVQLLTIQYPATDGPNEIATLYDGMLS